MNTKSVTPTNPPPHPNSVGSQYSIPVSVLVLSVSLFCLCSCSVFHLVLPVSFSSSCSYTIWFLFWLCPPSISFSLPLQLQCIPLLCNLSCPLSVPHTLSSLSIFRKDHSFFSPMFQLFLVLILAPRFSSFLSNYFVLLYCCA